MNIYTTQIPKKKVKELMEALEPYSALWSEWIESVACFLTYKEIIIIENYLRTGSYSASSMELSLSTGRAASILVKVQRRLRWNLRNYQSWMTDRLLEQHGIITYTSEVDRFLNVPISNTNIPYRLKRKLSNLSHDTMGELLNNYSLKEMKGYRCFGNQTICDLKETLKANNCLQLLR
ncbi:MAG: hypothetical protein M3Q58_07585 [Bacteroidota bacterium]|nr:hypothetical protein [Bacteroidota bacterium]